MKKMFFSLLYISVIGVLTINAKSLMLTTQKVNVIDSEPIYKDIIKRTPYQECWDEQIPINSNNNNNNIGALIGGVTGGIIGHQVGKGNGNTVATVGGAILGTLVGKNLSNNNNNNVVNYKTVHKCINKYNETNEKIIIEYKNIAYYKNKRIIKYSNYPLQYIIVKQFIEY